MGDANLALINATDKITLHYKQSLENLNLKQLITDPTTMYKSALDHIWISNKNTKTFHSVRTTYYTDHMPLLLDIC